MLSAKWQLLVLDAVDQRKENVCAQTHREYVDRRIYIPAEPLRKLLKNNNRGVAGTYEEHIHVFLQAELHKAVEPKGHGAQSQEGAGCTGIIRFLIAAPLGKADK